MRRLFVTAAVSATLVVGFSACASSGSSASGASTVNESSPDRITSVEIEKTQGASNAYDLVRRLRPRWLQTSGTGSIGGGRIQGQSILVYLDGNRLGTIEALKTLSASGIKTMQYYDATRAATVLREIGSDPIAGAIVVSTTGK